MNFSNYSFDELMTAYLDTLADLIELDERRKDLESKINSFAFFQSFDFVSVHADENLYLPVDIDELTPEDLTRFEVERTYTNSFGERVLILSD